MTQNNTLDPKIIARVRKLLALAADGGATQAEGELAAEMARKLMVEYGLSTATVEAQGGTGESRVKDEYGGLAAQWWQPPLMEAICATCFVYVERTFTTDRGGRTLGSGYRMIGRESGVATARVLFEYLCATVERSCREYVRANPGTTKPKWFRRGMSERLVERITERHEAAMEQQAAEARERNAAARHPAAATGTALVVVLEDYAQKEKDLNEDLRRGVAPGTTARERDEYEQRAARAQQQREERFNAALAALLAQGVAEVLASRAAQYVAHGFKQERALELADEEQQEYQKRAAKPPKEETPAQRARREEREARARERYWAKHEREARKRTSTEWRSGRAAAQHVGLDPQVGTSATKKLGG